MPLSPIINKDIHGDEFRLRLLVTNTCDRECPQCLNDFQTKPEHPRDIAYMNVDDAHLATIYYTEARRKFYPEQEANIINISGGEPGLHPELGKIIERAHITSGVFTPLSLVLNTNGLAFKHHDFNFFKKQLSCIRVHLQPGDTMEYGDFSRVPIEYQTVYRSSAPEKEREYADLIKRYYKVKFFLNFYGQAELSISYTNFIKRMTQQFGSDRVSARFTGKQENRGPLCTGCRKTCITLKAAWVDPWGHMYGCPQNMSLGTIPGREDNVICQPLMDNIAKLHRKD